MHFASRIFKRFAPSVLAAWIGALVLGAIDVLPASQSVVHGAGTLGFFMAAFLPIGIALSLVLRGLWTAWFPRDHVDSSPFDVLAWSLTIVTEVAVFAFAMNAITQNVLLSTKTPNAASVILTVISIVLALGLVLISRPLARFLKWGAEASLSALGWRWLQRPIAVVFVVGSLGVLLAYVFWLKALGPKLSYLNLTHGWEALAFIILVAAFTAMPMARRLRRVLGFSIVLGALLLASSAALLWRHAPARLLASWGETFWSGMVIEAVTDLPRLRQYKSKSGDIPQIVASADHPNIVLITVDALRPSRMKLFGGKASMPAVETLASNAVVFERAYAAGNVTRRSIPSMVTGLYPGRIRGRVVGWGLRMDPRHLTLAERLEAVGYQSVGFFCCDSIFGPKKKLGLERGFDSVAIAKEGEVLSEMAVDWLESKKSSKPVFMWVHFFDPHQWKEKTKGSKVRKSIKERYDLTIRKADVHIARVLSELEKNLGPNLVIVLTSDHGEGLGDHGNESHGKTLYDSEVRVPLIIKGPRFAPRKIENTTSLVDIAPTLLEIAGAEVPTFPVMDGTSLVLAMEDDTDPSAQSGEAYVRTVKDHSVKNEIRALVRGDYKVIVTRGQKSAELFDTAKDPEELSDLSGDKPAIFQDMIDKMKSYKKNEETSAF